MKHLPFPEKRYEIIYADPPWDYGGSRRMPVRSKDAKYPSNPADFYPVMSFDDIYALPVREIAGQNCLLFLWVVSPMIEACLETGRRWGFKFSTLAFVWDKQIPNAGHYTISQCELCFVFRRGVIPKPRGKRNIKQFLSCRRGRHSEKPLEVKHRILEMFPTQTKIELFARPGLLDLDMGWDYWGNEVPDEVSAVS